MNKWYIHKPESVLENETHKLLLDFDIQTDHLISAKRPNFMIINKKEKKEEEKKKRKKNLPNSRFCRSG